MAKKRRLKLSGKTTEDKPVLTGVFSFVGSIGLPLAPLLEYLRENGYVVDWLDYIEAALKDGANIETIKSRISAEVADAYGPKYRDEIMKRVSYFYPEV